MALGDMLGRVITIDGVRAAVLAGREGLVIAQTDLPLLEAEALAAFGAGVLNAAEGMGAETRRDMLIGTVIEYADALVSVDPLGEMACTVTQLDSAAALVPLRLTLRQMRGELLSALDAQ